MRSGKLLQPEVPPLAPLPPRAEPLPIVWRWIAISILVVYLALSAGHASFVPVLAPSEGSLINAPDEAAHWGYVQVLAREGRLPRRQVDSTYEWHQPPLYYSIERILFPAGPHAGRWMTIVMGLLSTCMVFMFVRRLFPSDPILAVFAMGVSALLPMRQAVYASVGNDALLELFCSAIFVALAPAFTHGFTARRAAALGFILGAALLTKANAFLMVPITLFALYLLGKIAEETRRAIMLGGVLLFLVAVAATFPLFVRNVQLYGQPLPLSAFKEEFAHTSKAEPNWIGRHVTVNTWTGSLEPSDEVMTRAGYLSLLANWTYRTMIGAYTPLGRTASQGVPVFPEPQFYLIHFLLFAAANIGLVRLHFRRKREFNKVQLAFIWMMFAFVGLVALAFAGFTWTYFQAQGRYLYPAMLPLAVLGALGVNSLIPKVRRGSVVLGILALMALVAAVFLFVYVQPTYMIEPTSGAPA